MSDLHDICHRNGGDDASELPLTIRQAPAWVTGELIDQTIRVWQPYYAIRLTRDDAVEIILNVGRLYDSLSVERHDETVRRIGPCEQP